MNKPLLIIIITVFNLNFNYSQNYDWVKSIGDSASDWGKAIATDVAGNVYCAGHFQGIVDFDPGPSTYTLTSKGNDWDVFLLKLDALGNFIWTIQFGDLQTDDVKGIKLDNSGNVYLTGYFTGTVDFDPGIGTFNLTASGLTDIFVIKLNSNGSLLWARKMGGINYEQGFGIDVDGFGNVYTTGQFFGTSDFDPGIGVYNLTSVGFYDAFISKLDAAGNFLWAKRFGGSSFDQGTKIRIDGAGNVLSVGTFSSSSVDFDPGVGTYIINNSGSIDIYISKLDASGNFIWAKGIGGGGMEWIGDFTIDSGANILLTGAFASINLDFDPSAGTYSLSPIGNKDAYLLKLDPFGNFDWVVQYGGVAGEVFGTAIKTDGLGNIFVGGHFKDTIDFNPGPGTYTFSSNGTATDIYLGIFNASGAFMWAGNMGGNGDEYLDDLIINSSGDFYSTGGFKSNMADFDPTSGINLLNTNGDYDVYILKMNSGSLGQVQLFSQPRIDVFPIPAKNKINVLYNNDIKINEVLLFNELGSKMELKSNSTNEIDIENFSDGFYILRFITNKGIVNRKIIKR